MVLTLEALAVSRIKTLLKLVLYDLDKNTNCSIFYDTGCIMYVFTGGVVARQKCQSDDLSVCRVVFPFVLQSSPARYVDRSEKSIYKLEGHSVERIPPPRPYNLLYSVNSYPKSDS